jgi:ubiquinol-cytochrome c reductase cytochrome b subunit
MGGYFLEYNNFLPANSLQTPPHIAPTWYFTPFYSVLRATTSDFMWVVMAGLAAYVVFIWLRSRLSYKTKLAIAVLGVILEIGMLTLEAKFWGVVLFGSAVVILALLPWLDHSPVKSIRYRPSWHKYVYAVFFVCFLALGYLGTQLPTPAYTLTAQVATLLYFSFFLLMPWWSTMGRFKPLPKRVTFTPH